MSISLNCLVLGDDPDCLFGVEIPLNKNISNLKDLLIKEKNTPRLDNIAPTQLQLWRVDFPVERLEKELKMFNPANWPKLTPPSKKLNAFFEVVSEDHLQVIVGVPEVVQRATAASILSLNCFILGDDADRFFNVEISSNKSINNLKGMIKAEKAPHLNHIAASDLDLWQVSVPVDDLVSKNPPTLGPPLRPQKLLSVVLPTDLDADCIHIVARLPDRRPPSLTSGPPPSAYISPLLSTNLLSQGRKKFCSKRKAEAPSNGGMPQNFLTRQQNDEEYIPCNRPYGRPTAMPLSLLHPVFGDFVHDAQNYVPTPEDAPFFLSFVKAMADIYDQESGRQAAILDIFNEHHMHLKGTSLGKFTTDGDLSIGEFRSLIVEFKNEIGSKGAEPFFQGNLYYLEATRKHAPRHPNTVLPCILMLIFGPFVAFAGAAWTDRPTVQMLSPAIPCHYQDTDINMEGMLVRHLGALRRAIRSLDIYYQAYNADPASPRHNPTHPCPTTYTSQGGTTTHIEYLARMKGRNLFFGRTGNTPICVKFVPRYCEQVHKFFAAESLAPELHAVQFLRGGLYMVIMADVSQDYISLFQYKQEHPNLWSEEHQSDRASLSEKIRSSLLRLHEAGLVHGDIRDTNTMVTKDRLQNGTFLMVDYDSCGTANQVTYPLHLNVMSVWRPEGAIGGAVIETEHDLAMLDHIWDHES